jgi:hypothetical protein
MLRIVDEYKLVIKLKLVTLSYRGLIYGITPEICLKRQRKTTSVFTHIIRCPTPESNRTYPVHNSEKSPVTAARYDAVLLHSSESPDAMNLVP